MTELPHQVLGAALEDAQVPPDLIRVILGFHARVLLCLREHGMQISRQQGTLCWENAQ